MCTSKNYKGKLGAGEEINQADKNCNRMLKDFSVLNNLTKIFSTAENTNR